MQTMTNRFSTAWFHSLIASIVLLAACSTGFADEQPKADALGLFEQRIMPIFKSKRPSSCVQCHLSAVDIKNYILPSHTDTFVALRDQGLVDVKDPMKSKILTLIKMGEKDLDKGARLIHERTRKAEYEAFKSWIMACCSDPEFAKLPASSKVASVGPEKPIEIVRHARKSRVVESFTRNIWSQRMRCFPCHTPHELDHANPKHKVLFERNEKLLKQFGEKMNIFQKTPEETMARLISSSRRTVPDRYPLINITDPKKSLLLLKPTSKLPQKKDDGTFEQPSSFDPVSHMGGLKMHVNDQSYKSFMIWLQDYSATVGDKYVDLKDLPVDNWVPTKRVIRIKDVPAAWGEHSVVQVFVHAKSDTKDGWSKEPVAFTQGTITPRRMIVGALSLIRLHRAKPVGDRAPFALRPGKFLIKVYVDSKDRVSADPAVLLGPEELVGQAEINAHWQIGFPKAETISASAIRK